MVGDAREEAGAHLLAPLLSLSPFFIIANALCTYPWSRRGATKHRAILKNLPSTFSWKELKDEMRRIGDVIYADVDNHGDGLVPRASQY